MYSIQILEIIKFGKDLELNFLIDITFYTNMKLLINLTIPKIHQIVSSVFIVLAILLTSYLVQKEKKSQFLFTFSIEYEKKLIDQSIYRLYVASKFPEYHFERGGRYYVKCDTLIICEEKELSFLQDIQKLNISLWNTTKDFVDDKINEINKKLSEARPELLLRDLSLKKKESGADANLNVFLDSYKYILNLEYLRGQNEPMIVLATTEIIDNRWNSFFTKFYNIIILDLVISLSLFIFLYSFSNKRSK
jgi:hypothetical protein